MVYFDEIKIRPMLDSKNVMRHSVSYKSSTVALFRSKNSKNGVYSVKLEELTALADWVNSLEEYHTIL